MKRHLSSAKRLLLAITAAFCLGLTGNAKASDDSRLPESALKTLENCIMLVDNGLSETALEDFDKLVSLYPDSYIIQYERMFALQKLKRYDEVIKVAKKLINHENATALVYHVYGNALDDSGKTKEAVRIYDQGLRRFPDAGMLYLEKGIICAREKRWADALNEYEEGIVADPDFASNYYRAAQLLFGSGEKNRVWALVYGEAAMLLDMSQDARREEMCRDIRDLWLASVSTEKKDNDSIKMEVALMEGPAIQINKKTEDVYLSFGGVYEGATALTILMDFDAMCPFTASLQQLISLRKGIVENYFKGTDNLYGNSMYLFPYQKSIIDAGHWEAYNYFVFKEIFPDEFVQWYDRNSGKMKKFSDWYSRHPFSLDATHTVSDRLVNRDARSLSALEAMTIMSFYLPDKDKAPSAD